MDDITKKIRYERVRLKQVRTGLTEALVKGAQGNRAYADYYVAVGDYIEAAMVRLDLQDVRMMKMLRERIDAGNTDAADALAEVDERLAENQRLLNPFLAARDELREKGAAAIEAYESAARTYTDYIAANMGHHGASTALARQEFSPEDWAFMANSREENIAREMRLFDAVETAKP